jgi:hypothetical protein
MNVFLKTIFWWFVVMAVFAAMGTLLVLGAVALVGLSGFPESIIGYGIAGLFFGLLACFSWGSAKDIVANRTHKKNGTGKGQVEDEEDSKEEN